MKKTSALYVSLCLLAASQASALSISNIAYPRSGENSLSPTGVANAFTVGNETVTLDSVDLYMHSSYFSGGGDVLYTASIHLDNAGSFGAILGTVGSYLDNTLGGFEVVNIPATSTITLNANTTYWLRSQIAADDLSGWNITNITFENGDAGWSIGNQAIFVGSSSTAPAMFAINATAVVPEPSSYAAFAGLAAMGLTLTRRRSRVRGIIRGGQQK